MSGDKKNIGSEAALPIKAPADAEITPEPYAPRDATRAEKEEIVYLSLPNLHPFKTHPFGVRDDAEMQRACGISQGGGCQSARTGASLNTG